jgi:AraC-like DNA-binding protein
VRYPMGVAMRSLFVDVERLDVALPASCAVFELDALAREMVKEIADYAWDQVLEGANAYVVKALLARLSASRPGKIFLPAGKDPRVVRTMNHLRQHPAANERVETLAARVHCSHRTLARLFVSDTGMSVGAWRTQLKLQAALERIASGTPIGTVAIELGHDPSTFSTLFKKTLGVSPARYFS